MQASEGEGELVVGVAWPWEARRELRFGEGLEMALDEVNAAGGIQGRPLSILRKDDGESVNQGRLVAQELGQDPRVVAVIGHLQSHVTVPAAAIYDMTGLLLLAPAATATHLTDQGFQRVFRLTFDDTRVGDRMAEYALQQGYEEIVILYVRSDYGRAVANAFSERLSGTACTVVARESYAPDDSIHAGALAPLLSEWRQLDPDAIFLAAEVPAAGELIAAFRAAGIDAPIIGGDAMSSPALIAVGGEATEGTVVASFFQADEPRPETQRFVSDYRARYDVPPDAGAALGYDAIHVLAQAMRLAPFPAPDEIAEALRSMPAWEGATGSFRFDDHGNLMDRRTTLSRVEDGRFVFAGEVRPTTSPDDRAGGGVEVPGAPESDGFEQLARRFRP